MEQQKIMSTSRSSSCLWFASCGYRALFWRTALPKAFSAACDADPGDEHRRGRSRRLWRSAACRDRAGDGKEMSDAMTQARKARPQR
jgi:hypothetical protein